MAWGPAGGPAVLRADVAMMVPSSSAMSDNCRPPTPQPLESIRRPLPPLGDAARLLLGRLMKGWHCGTASYIVI